MTSFRLSHSADGDIFDILAWSHDHFGELAGQRYGELIVASILHAAEHGDGVGFRSKAELGDGVLIWHLAQSTQRARGSVVRHPRHVLVCRWEGGVLVVGRVLHETMDPTRHLDPDTDWH
jgi:toxin ParE1/3/4